MPEIIDVERITPYGFKLTNGTYRKATLEVREFVQTKLPAKLEIEEAYEKEGITRVKVLARDLTQKYSPEVGLTPSPTPDKDTLIVRQSCLKAAVEILPKSVKGDTIENIIPTVTKLAEEFEKWVFR